MKILGALVFVVMAVGCGDEGTRAAGGGGSSYAAHNVRALYCGTKTCEKAQVCCGAEGAPDPYCGSPLGDYCGESGTPWSDCFTQTDCPDGWLCCSVKTSGGGKVSHCGEVCP